jgi:hypothetical protein
MKPILFLCSIGDLIMTAQGGSEAVKKMAEALYLPIDSREVALWHLSAAGRGRQCLRRLMTDAENAGRVEWSVKRDWPYVTAKAFNSLLARNFPGTPQLRELALPGGGRPEPFGPLFAMVAQAELELPVHVYTKPLLFPLAQQ